MKTVKMNKQHLRNEEHYQQMVDTLDLFNTAPDAVKTAVTAPLDEFAALVKRESDALEQIRKNLLTDDIARADALRDHLYYAICLKVEAYAYSNVESEVKASADVQVVIDHYGDFRRKSYNEESAIIRNFVDDLRLRQASLTLMGLDQWLNDLIAVNATMQQFMSQRFDEQAATQMENLREVRKQVDAVYGRLMSIIDASIIIHGEGAYVDFVNKLNERIRYYKNTVLTRRGRIKGEGAKV